MQKLAKRSAQAQRQASRQLQRSQRTAQARQRGETRDRLRAANAEIRQNIRDARVAQREDWELGPLAPKRDLGFNNYGLLKEPPRMDWNLQGRRLMHPKMLEQRCAWAGGSKQLNLAPQDRVVILEGPDKGKVDRIRAIDMGTGSVTLEKYNQAMAAGVLDNPPAAVSMPLPIDAIRLVYPITNPDTGITRDVVIHQLKAVSPNMQSPTMTFERWEYGNKWDRVVPGINVVIPWPEVAAPKFVTTAADSVRDQVEERTFHYSLLSPPMPGSVLNELRNPFSKFRTRHEAWYIAKKEAEEAEKKARHDTLKSMRTPLDELHDKQRETKAAHPEPELTDEMLQKLGEIIARKKASAMSEAGVSEVSSGAPAPPPASKPSSAPPGP